MIVPDLGDLAVFPCSAEKRPLIKAWRENARRIEPPETWPLVGVPTGAGFDVLDIDPEGLAWLAEHEPRLPTTRRHQTPKGWHILFRHAEGLHNSTSRIAPGVDVRGDGGYVIWWPREGLAVEEWPLVDWPGWLLDLGRKRNPSTVKGKGQGEGDVASDLAEAFTKLDVLQYRNHDDWLRLMMAARRSGINREAFIAWSIGDPAYADDAEEIGRRWDSLGEGGAVTRRTLFYELGKAGIRVGPATPHSPHSPSSTATPARVPLTAGTETFKPTRNLPNRVNSILRMIERGRDNDTLFRGACLLAEIVGIERKLKARVAISLLESTCQVSGLWRNPTECRETIASAFRRVELKLLEAS